MRTRKEAEAARPRPTLPERPDLPDQAMGAPSGRPEPVPHARPDDLPVADRFCTETGLPRVAVADDCKEEEEEPEDVLA